MISFQTFIKERNNFLLTTLRYDQDVNVCVLCTSGYKCRIATSLAYPNVDAPGMRAPPPPLRSKMFLISCSF